jgi:hypothetical protein
MCFICGAPCIGVATECGFAFEFCDGCLVEYDQPFLHRVMEARHLSECGCPDVTDLPDVGDVPFDAARAAPLPN